MNSTHLIIRRILEYFRRGGLLPQLSKDRRRVERYQRRRGEEAGADQPRSDQDRLDDGNRSGDRLENADRDVDQLEYSDRSEDGDRLEDNNWLEDGDRLEDYEQRLIADIQLLEAQGDDTSVNQNYRKLFKILNNRIRNSR